MATTVCSSCKSQICKCNYNENYQIAIGMMIEWVLYCSRIVSHALDINLSTEGEQWWKVNKMRRKFLRVVEESFINGRGALLAIKGVGVVNIDNIIFLECNDKDEVLSIIYQLPQLSPDSTFRGYIVGNYSINKTNGKYNYRQGYWLDGWVPFDPKWTTPNIEDTQIDVDECPVFIFRHLERVNDVFTEHNNFMKKIIKAIYKEIVLIDTDGVKVLIDHNGSKNEMRFKKLLDKITTDSKYSLVDMKLPELQSSLITIKSSISLDQMQVNIQKSKAELLKELFVPIGMSDGAATNKQSLEVSLQITPQIDYLRDLADEKEEELEKLFEYMNVNTTVSIETTELQPDDEQPQPGGVANESN